MMANAVFVLSAGAIVVLAAYLIKAVSKLDTAGRVNEVPGGDEPHPSPTATPEGELPQSGKRSHSGVSPQGEGFGTVDLDLFGKFRPTMTVKMPVTGEVLHIKMPTKRIADSLAEIGQLMEAFSKGRADDGSIDRMYSLTGVVLSNNQESKRFYDLYDLKNLLSTDDCADVLTQYLRFMTAQLDSKN